ncbi:hypothetical protein SDC9_193723 [bioreactor metagenome]|uniref:Uncharacterized protein n=1 Tax=bioreactor metagenome TaxID=1076179 RepID=A0A645I4V9_9ZZZZ
MARCPQKKGDEGNAEAEFALGDEACMGTLRQDMHDDGNVEEALVVREDDEAFGERLRELILEMDLEAPILAEHQEDEIDGLVFVEEFPSARGFPRSEDDDEEERKLPQGEGAQEHYYYDNIHGVFSGNRLILYPI